MCLPIWESIFDLFSAIRRLTMLSYVRFCRVHTKRFEDTPDLISAVRYTKPGLNPLLCLTDSPVILFVQALTQLLFLPG